jgi:hypothetical protein
MDSTTDQDRGNVLAFDANRPRALRGAGVQTGNEKSLLNILSPQNGATVLMLTLERRPLETMSEADITSPAIGAVDFSDFRRELQTIEQAYRKGRRAGRMAVIAALRAEHAAGYNCGASDERTNVNDAIDQLIA